MTKTRVDGYCKKCGAYSNSIHMEWDGICSACNNTYSDTINTIYIPIHEKCEKTVDKPSKSIEEIFDRFENGENDFCAHCEEKIKSIHDIIIQELSE